MEYSTFVKNLRLMRQNRVSMASIAKRYNINQWHVWQMLNNPNYRPSAQVAKRCGFRRDPHPPRFAVPYNTEQAFQVIRRHLPPEERERLAMLLLEDAYRF